ncbi:MAG TPA: lipoyl(octanoyl) transferase LipB [Candidatus Thermoplasmatota archaeon]|nr:lipoyl(octanoyl) transferase LipB [Candidatus Thermoplasmatota archaeon]
MARELLVLDLGTRAYTEVHATQLRLHELRVLGALPDVLVLVEHPHVATLGRRGTRAQVFDPALPVVETERGGEATYHGPGQLVAYPIVKLPEAGWGVKQLVQALAESAVRLLADLGIDSKAGETKEAVGVWVGGKKVASIGLAIRRDVSFHGMAVNLNTDLGYFQRIQPCGLEGGVMTSAERLLGHPVDMTKAREILAHAFADQLGAAPRSVTERDLTERLQC